MPDADSKPPRPSVSDIIAAARKTPAPAKPEAAEPHRQVEDGWEVSRSQGAVTYWLHVPQVDVARFKQAVDQFWRKLLAVAAERRRRQDAFYLELDLVEGNVCATFSGSRPLGGKAPTERDETVSVNIYSAWIESETDDILSNDPSPEAETAALGRLESSLLQMIVEAFRALRRQGPAAAASLAESVGAFARQRGAKDLFELQLFDDRPSFFSPVSPEAPVTVPCTDQEVAAVELEKLATRQAIDAITKRQGAVVEVYLVRSVALTDESLKYLRAFPKLEKLFLDHTQITDAGLAHVEQLTSLKRLGLAGTQITDAGLARLANLKKLFELDLRSTQVTAAGAEKLRPALPAIKRLMVG